MMNQQANAATTSYHQAFDRIRAEYVEMPGMRLTPQQVQRLTGVDVALCETVLADLVGSKFLQVAEDATYLRGGAESAVRSSQGGGA
jgi:hypothetical protein